VRIEIVVMGNGNENNPQNTLSNTQVSKCTLQLCPKHPYFWEFLVHYSALLSWFLESTKIDQSREFYHSNTAKHSLPPSFYKLWFLC